MAIFNSYVKLPKGIHKGVQIPFIAGWLTMELMEHPING